MERKGEMEGLIGLHRQGGGGWRWLVWMGIDGWGLEEGPATRSFGRGRIQD